MMTNEGWQRRNCHRIHPSVTWELISFETDHRQQQAEHGNHVRRAFVFLDFEPLKCEQVFMLCWLIWHIDSSGDIIYLQNYVYSQYTAIESQKQMWHMISFWAHLIYSVLMMHSFSSGSPHRQFLCYKHIGKKTQQSTVPLSHHTNQGQWALVIVNTTRWALQMVSKNNESANLR